MMRAALLSLALAAGLFLSACSDDDEDLTRIEEMPADTFGFIVGTEDGEVMYPVIELWNIPECRCEELVTNTPHNTRVRIHAFKPDCPGSPYEVEILAGEKAGARGWVLGKHIEFEGDPPDLGASPSP